MATSSSCQACGLSRAGALATQVCYPCRENHSRRRFCIAFNDAGGLRPFLAADDEEVMRNCSLRLTAQGHDFVTMEWNSERDCYAVC